MRAGLSPGRMALLIDAHLLCHHQLQQLNIRLALSESFMWFAAAFGFYCFYLRQLKNLVEPKTYI